MCYYVNVVTNFSLFNILSCGSAFVLAQLAATVDRS
jgi:hypothetical protein